MSRTKRITHRARVYFETTGKIIPYYHEHERYRASRWRDDLGRKKGPKPSRKPKEKK